MINLTDAAIDEVKRRIEEHKIENALLRIGIEGGGCSGMNYAFDFDESQKVEDTDTVREIENFKLACDAKSYLFLNGMTIDFQKSMLGGGFKFDNPNASRTCGCGTSFSV